MAGAGSGVNACTTSSACVDCVAGRGGRVDGVRVVPVDRTGLGRMSGGVGGSTAGASFRRSQVPGCAQPGPPGWNSILRQAGLKCVGR